MMSTLRMETLTQKRNTGPHLARANFMGEGAGLVQIMKHTNGAEPVLKGISWSRQYCDSILEPPRPVMTNLMYCSMAMVMTTSRRVSEYLPMKGKIIPKAVTVTSRKGTHAR